MPRRAIEAMLDRNYGPLLPPPRRRQEPHCWHCKQPLTLCCPTRGTYHAEGRGRQEREMEREKRRAR